MDGGVNGSTTTTATVVDETVDDFPPSPPHGPDFSPVGSPESDDVPLPPSDDDPDHLPAEDQPKDLELSSAVPALTDDLKLKIMKQVIFFSLSLVLLISIICSRVIIGSCELKK